ncbi:MAG: PorV/PorQ family protein [Candidatus Zixiibacteriota bacterium]
MRRPGIAVVLSLGLLLSLGSVAGAADGDGGYAASFLQVPIGARPAGMGAYLAVSNDGAAPLFNPAGLAGLDHKLFATSYRAMQLDRVLGYATAIFPARGQSALGVHWLYAGSGSVAMRDYNGVPTGEDFSLNSHVFSIVFAKRFERYLAIGTKLNYFHSLMPDVKAFSVGFDFGGMLYVDQFINREKRETMPIRDIQLALTLKNFAAKYMWNSEKFNRSRSGYGELGYDQDDQVPIEVGLGGSARFLNRKLLLATDLVKNTKQDPVFRGGAEYFVTPEFAIRGGYAASRFSAGTGYAFKLGKQAAMIDYAFNSDRVDEGSEHIFSLEVLF